MRIRRATEDDLDAFVGVLAAVAEEGHWIATEAPVDVRARIAALRTFMAGGDMLFVAEDGGRIVGNGGLHQTGRRGVVALGMALLADMRGRGLGRELLRAMIEHAAANGVRRIELEVFPGNERAVRLYRSVGFREEALRPGALPRKDGSRKDVLAMSLSVPVSQ